MGHVLLESATQEEALTGFLRRIGPVIALGQPGERLRPLGAARLRVPDEEWQSKVLRLITDSKVIVFRVSRSRGLEWEIDQALHIADLQRLVFWFTSRFAYNHFMDGFQMVIGTNNARRCDFLFFKKDNSPEFITVSAPIRFASAKLFIQCGIGPYLVKLGFRPRTRREIEQEARSVWLRRIGIAVGVAMLIDQAIWLLQGPLPR